MSSTPTPIQRDLESVIENIGGLKERIKSLEREVAASKKENKGWIKMWGVYLGVLASVVAVPKAAKEAIDSWYQHADLKIVQPDDLTLTRNSGENGIVFSFPVIASNYGNRVGSISGGHAHLEAISSVAWSSDAANSNFKLADENKILGKMPFPMPAGLAKTLTGYVSFDDVVHDPGWYRLEVTLTDETGRPVPKTPMKFCFEVTPSQIKNLARQPSDHIYPNCD